MLTYFDVIHLATCCHKNQLHNFAVRGYLAITFFGYLQNNEKMTIALFSDFSRSSGFPTRSDTNWAEQLQKMARGLKFRIYEVEGLYYLCSENKGADQFRG